MQKISIRRALFFFFFVFSIYFNGISHAVSANSGLVSSDLLEHANLKILWQNELPLKKSETLDRMMICKNRIYALSDTNYLFSLNRTKGSMIFAKPVATAGFTVVGLKAYNDKGSDVLLSLISGAIVELNIETGIEISRKRLGYGVVSPLARNSEYYYVAGVDRRTHVLRASDKVEIFEVSADDNSIITSIIADDGFVIFATDSGSLVSVSYDSPRKLWQFDASGAVSGSIVHDGDSLFISSEDTNVYKIDVKTGELQWKYQTEAFLDRNCIVAKKAVYQHIRNKGLAAIDKTTGKLLWHLDEGIDLLSEAGGKAYIITKSGNLIVMDNAAGKVLYSVNFAGVSKYVSNTADSRIYIGDEMGRVACLRPVK